MGSLTKAIVFALFLSFVSDHCFASPLGFPLHASCKINWKFGITCQSVSQKIKDQIIKWSHNDCGTGEKCKYEFVSFENDVLKAKHVTPTKEYVDDLTFNFSPSSSACSVKGYSTSETWFAVLDYSTNYCNLHNLITGSGLDQVTGYSEDTSNSVCTQYSSANCDKY